MTVESSLLLAAVVFLLGYIIGHRHGRVEGFRDGALLAPLEIRRETLERGRCVICGATAMAPRRAEPGPGPRAEARGAGRRSDREGE